MPVDISEKNFEATVEQVLLDGLPTPKGRKAAPAVEGVYTPGGYRKRKPEHYHRSLCLDPDVVLEFVYATQPQEWAKLKAQHGADLKPKFLNRLAAEIGKRGTLDVLRKGIKDSGCKFQLAYFKPSSGMNQNTQTLYAANQFTIIRQLKFSEKTEQSLDVVLFLNGLPIFTAELKNPLTGQTVEHAVTQYRNDRDPRETLFAFGRCLAHFAVDPDLVYMTTHLQKEKTRFLPYNVGRNGGAGNPPSARGFATAYLWEQTWSRDSVLDLIQNFVQAVEEEDDKGKKTGKVSLLFPRYHQLDCVRRLVADCRTKGTGQHYLIQHSAGSGKSNSIAWLAHQLSALHDASEKRVFDTIVVITDRRILDRQLQRNVLAFEQTLGLVENIDKTSRQLKQALEDGKTIIVTTLQKFPVIAKDMGEMPGKRFAVVIDEAHSSQSGETSKGWKSVLSVKSLEGEENDEEEDGDNLEDRINEEARLRGRLPNVSIFAFTATPKSKTLELFGVKRADGKYEAFSLYTMRQAIEEQFILDVLANYTTYKAYWSLLKRITDDPRYERKKAYALLRSFVDHHEATVRKKVAIMAEHFTSQSMPRIGGKAKAMVVCRSRPQAVLYKRLFDAYLKAKGWPFKVLVAFSGAVKYKGVEYTESGMNSTPEEKIGETQTADAFKRDEYRFLIVANKFQTGFDQPLLHTMYVDKKLGGVNAVQTLSRLNRTCPNKNETVVLDFANDDEEIHKAFQPYYERTLLAQGTDPNLLYDLHTRLAQYYLYTASEIDAFAKVWFDPKATQDKLNYLLQPAKDRFEGASREDQQQFRSQLGDYVRLYAFLSQIVAFTDPELEKLYVYGRLLLRKMKAKPGEQLPVEIQQDIDVDSYRVQHTSSGKIRLERGTSELEPITGGNIFQPPPEEVEALSAILKALNDRFGTDFADDDKVFIRQLEEKLAGDPALEASVKVNVPENARLTFDHVANDRIQEMIDSNFKFYKQITDDQDFERFFLGWLFERYKQRTGKEAA